MNFKTTTLTAAIALALGAGAAGAQTVRTITVPLDGSAATPSSDGGWTYVATPAGEAPVGADLTAAPPATVTGQLIPNPPVPGAEAAVPVTAADAPATTAAAPVTATADAATTTTTTATTTAPQAEAAPVAAVETAPAATPEAAAPATEGTTTTASSPDAPQGAAETVAAPLAETVATPAAEPATAPAADAAPATATAAAPAAAESPAATGGTPGAGEVPAPPVDQATAIDAPAGPEPAAPSGVDVSATTEPGAAPAEAPAAAAPAGEHAAAGAHTQHITDVAFPFEGPFGRFDQFQLQRGLQVYTEVCSSCHGMKYVPLRTLADPGGPGLPEDQVRAYAATMEIPDAETGETRPRTPTDHFPTVTGEGMGPDLSVMAKARAGFHGPYGTGINQFLHGMGGPEYIYSVLTGYTGNTKEEAGTTFYENKAFSTGWIAMPPPLADDQVTYQDGHPSALPDMAKDVAAFLMWTAEPKMMSRKKAGLVAVVLLTALTALLYLTNKRLWWSVKHGRREGV